MSDHRESTPSNGTEREVRFLPFRQTFIQHLAEAESAAAMKLLGSLILQGVVEKRRDWHEQEESGIRRDVHAAATDLHFLVRFLEHEVLCASESALVKEPKDRRLVVLARNAAIDIAKVAERLDAELRRP